MMYDEALDADARIMNFGKTHGLCRQVCNLDVEWLPWQGVVQTSCIPTTLAIFDNSMGLNRQEPFTTGINAQSCLGKVCIMT